MLDAVYRAIDEVKPIADVVKRVDAVFASLTPLMLEHEAELRTLLKLSLERSLRDDVISDTPLRSINWMFMWDAVLDPLRDRVLPKRYVLMARALSTLLGVESLLIFRDTCDGNVKRTVDSVRHVASAMIRGFLLDIERIDRTQ